MTAKIKVFNRITNQNRKLEKLEQKVGEKILFTNKIRNVERKWKNISGCLHN